MPLAYLRSWAFPFFSSSLLLALVCFALPQDRFSVDNSSAAISKNRFSAQTPRRIPPEQTQRSPDQGLMFDPVLVYSTFLGGTASGGVSLMGPSSGPPQLFAQGVTASVVDGSGNLYVAGSTTAADFPTTPGVIQPTNAQNNSVGFLSKINPAGQLIFSTYLQGMQSVASIAVDPQNQSVYVAGVSTLAGTATTPLPIPPNTTPFQSAPKPISIIKLNSAGTAVLNATYLGGSALDLVSGLALDPTGNVYVAGYTTSNDFPTMNPLQASIGTAGRNAFVTKLTPDLSGLVYSTYLGQNNSVVGAGVATPTGTANHGVAVDSSGNAYVILTGAAAGCLAKLNANGSSVLYPNFSCGANAIAVDSSQNIYAVGQTTGAVSGSLAPCPQTAPVPTPPTWEGAGGYVSEFSSAGTLTFSTCLGLLVSGNGGPRANGGVNDLVLDNSGNIYVIGSADDGIPLTNSIQGVTSMFLAIIDPKTPSLLFASGVGTTASSALAPTNVAVDSNGNLYASGFITDPSSFPVFNALQPVPGMILPPSNCVGCSPGNGFVLEIAPTNAAAAAVSPALLAFATQPVSTTSSAQTVTISDLGSAPLTVSNVSVTGDFAIQNGCTTVSAAGGTCTIQATFTPTATGTRTGTLVITDNSAGSPHTVQLAGTGGQGAVTLSPTTLSFDNQSVGTTSTPQTVTLTNSGALSLQISRIQTSGPFDESNNCGTSLAASSACTITVTFAPTSSGASTGMLTFADSAADSPQAVALSGNTTTQAPPSIGIGIPSGGSATATVTAGATATYALAIGGAGLGGTASLTCTGAPTGATCSVPNSIPLNATTPSSFNVTVTTTAASQTFPFRFNPTLFLCALALLGCLALARAATTLRSARAWSLAPMLALTLCACGGGNSSSNSTTPNGNSTSAGNYTIIVTAKSGSTTQSQNLTLIVK